MRKITIELIKNKDLSQIQKNAINKGRVLNWGEEARQDIGKHYEPNTIWIFVKDNGKIVSFGGLRPIQIDYLGKKYNILGICSTISLIKGKSYGTMMVAGMLNHLKRTEKSALGFTDEIPFFKKTGLKIAKGIIQRFVYVNPKTGKKIHDNDGDGIYYNGKDNFMKKLLSTKSSVPISVEHW